MIPDLDVVVLQCGQSELTLRLLDSVYLSAPWVSVTLVDNGSPGPDLEAARARLRPGDYLIANEENLGFARAVNQGLRASHAEYACIQNNDTVMEAHGYERMLAHLEADPTLGLIGPMTGAADSEQRGVGGGEGVAYASGLVAFFCTIIPRRVLREVGLLSEEYGLGYGEDNDYCLRLRAAGYNLGIARDVYVHHDHHATYRALIGDAGIDELGRANAEKLMSKFGALQ